MASLVFCLADSSYYSRGMTGPDEIFLSPDEISPNNSTTFRIPAGSPSIEEIYSLYPQLPKNPGLVFIKTDALGRNFVRGISRLGCPSIVSVADTHHLHRPIERVLEYLNDECFSLISAENDRHHLKWLSRYGLSNLSWLPNLALTPRIHRVREISHKVNSACFVGSLGKFHPFRASVVESLQKSVPGFFACTANQEQASLLYNTYNISLNISLNSDLNWRFFEVIAAGGFLLTDRLPPDSGIELLFTEGVHYEAFSSEDELRHKIDYYTANPHASSGIAMMGQARYMEVCQPRILRKEMISRLFLNQGKALFSYPEVRDRRQSALSLNSEIRAYQALQEIHRISMSVNLLVLDCHHERFVHDLVDYPRITICVDIDIFRQVCRSPKAYGNACTNVICAASISSLQLLPQETISECNVLYAVCLDQLQNPYSFTINGFRYVYSETIDCYSISR